MSGIEDLKPFDFFPFDRQPKLRAIGWLENPTVSAGMPEERFFKKLFELLLDPWQPFVAMGNHLCSLCRFTGGPGAIFLNNQKVVIGNANLFVPGVDCVYVAPSSVIHYIDAHGYCPPAVFQEAVLSCPAMKSMDYFRALRRIISVKELMTPPDDLIM